MASKMFEKGTEEFMMFQDFWNLCRKYWIPEDNDGYWEQLIKATDNFCKKYENDNFARRIAMAFVDTAEEKYKSRDHP